MSVMNNEGVIQLLNRCNSVLTNLFLDRSLNLWEHGINLWTSSLLCARVLVGVELLATRFGCLELG